MNELYVIVKNDGTLHPSCYTQLEYAKTSLARLCNNDGKIFKLDRFALKKSDIEYLLKSNCFVEAR